MYTAVYMSESGKIEEKKFETLEESRTFFKELAKKNIPVKVHEADVKIKKTRIEELDSLIQRETGFIRKGPVSEIMEHVKQMVKYEIEKHDILMKK